MKKLLVLLCLVCVGCDNSDDDTDELVLTLKTFEVPRDHTDLSGEKIQLAYGIRPANNEEPLGTLWFNFGGPGGDFRLHADVPTACTVT